MQHERWRSGTLSTGFIAEEFPEGFSPIVAAGETQAVIAAVAAHVDHVQNVRKREISGQFRAGWSRSFDLKRAVMLGSARVDVEVELREGGVDVVFADGRRLRVVSPWTPGEPVWRGDIDEKPTVVQVRAILNGFALAHRGVAVAARVYTRREAALAALMIEREGADLSRSLHCPMPGLVKSIAVTEGQQVRPGDPLCVVEAMKMENQLSAERAATVKKIVAKVGEFARRRRRDHGIRLTPAAVAVERLSVLQVCVALAREDALSTTLARSGKLSIVVALAAAGGAASDERSDRVAWPLLCASTASSQEIVATGVFHGVGVVTAVDAAKGWLTLDHQAIDGFMGAMEMMYRAEPPRLAAGLRVGDHVAFDIEAGRYAIVGVKVLKDAD